MSIDRISKFYEAAMAQKKFSPEFFNELREISNETELKAFIEKEVQPIAKSMDYNFSTEDFLNYEEEITQNLTEQQLENVGGGVNVKNWILGGFISLMALGAGAVGATNFASAELDSKSVASSTATLTSEIEKEISVLQKEAKSDNINKNTEEIKTPEANNKIERTSQKTDLEKAKIATQVDQSEVVETQKLTDAQKLYALKALNLQDAYALL